MMQRHHACNDAKVLNICHQLKWQGHHTCRLCRVFVRPAKSCHNSDQRKCRLLDTLFIV